MSRKVSQSWTLSNWRDDQIETIRSTWDQIGLGSE
jgi:hypothetical protein